VEKLECLNFAEPFVFMKVIEKIAMLGIFKDYINLSFFFKDIIELYYVGVSQSPVDKYLSPEVFFINSRDFPSKIYLKVLWKFLVV
jgi:hypothetical protein